MRLAHFYGVSAIKRHIKAHIIARVITSILMKNEVGILIVQPLTKLGKPEMKFIH
jgi:hypothetical protein